MKKHLKIFSAVSSLVLAVCTIQAVFFQALAADEDTTTVAYDDEYTYDEATDDEFGLERSTPVSIEIVNADESIPETIEVHSFGKYDMSFWNDVVFLITYEDGYTEYFQSEFDKDGRALSLLKHSTSYEEFSVPEYISYGSANFLEVRCISKFQVCETTVPVNLVDAPDRAVKYELTKLPDKVFEAPLFTGEAPDYDTERLFEIQENCDVNNSVGLNMKGAEITVTYANGEKEVLKFDENKTEFSYDFTTMYSFQMDGGELLVEVQDTGDYKANIWVFESDCGQPIGSFTARSVENPNPELPTTDDMKYNEAISSPDEGAKSTIDEVATPDSKATDSNTKSTNDNAVVATGDVAVAAGVAVVMLIAAAVMVILKRRKSVLN